MLANLYGGELVRSVGLSIGALSERLEADPATLSRTLKPPAARGLVKDLTDLISTELFRAVSTALKLVAN